MIKNYKNWERAIAQGIINEVSAHNSETITQNNTNE